MVFGYALMTLNRGTGRLDADAKCDDKFNIFFPPLGKRGKSDGPAGSHHDRSRPRPDQHDLAGVSAEPDLLVQLARVARDAIPLCYK
jgi:hypothetical protein